MSAIRQKLDSHVFAPYNERILDIIAVFKDIKKKKLSYLCAVVTTKQPVIVSICLVKCSEKDMFKKKQQWDLQDLKTVDGKDPQNDCEFDLHFDRVYKWCSTSSADRNQFLRSLYRFCALYLPDQRKPTFKNIPRHLMDELQDSVDAQLPSLDSTKGIVEVGTGYDALSPKEESDLETLMLKYEYAVANAEAFSEQLARELSTLDATNVHAIMESEVKVQELMTMFQTTIEEVTKLEQKLDAYDYLLRGVRDSVARMEEKDSVIHIQHENNQRLLKELENLISQLELPNGYDLVLMKPNLNSLEGVQTACTAAKSLEDAMQAKINPALHRMIAVRDRLTHFENLKQQFGTALSRHLNSEFIRLRNEVTSTTLSHSSDFNLTKHSRTHTELSLYVPLMQWLKRNDASRFNSLKAEYINSMSKIYDKEIHQFFEQAHMHLQGSSSSDYPDNSRTAQEKKNSLTSEAAVLGLGRSSGMGFKQKSMSFLAGAGLDEGFDAGDVQIRNNFDQVLERLLSKLEPVYLAEQQFCSQFFALTSRGNNAETSGLPGSASSDNLDAASRTSSDEILTQVSKREKQLNNEMSALMGSLFGSLKSELEQFVRTYDGFYSMYLLVRLNRHIVTTQDTGSFLTVTFGTALIQAKRNFDTYMKTHIQHIEEAKIPKRNKCGILPFITRFEEFTNQAEKIFSDSDRRADLYKWYARIVNAMMGAVVRLSTEHPKTPKEVILLENFHHIFTLLFQLKKVTGLENDRKFAKEQYQQALQLYVTKYFGRPLEKLNTFFEGVQAKVAQGVKENEMAFQMAFSKQELRKVIKDYPSKEVKKGLENLYRKVEKHLSEEEGLLEVVWRSMQEEFINQYKAIESLIERCYPGSLITLDFTIEDILQFFSDIARSH